MKSRRPFIWLKSVTVIWVLFIAMAGGQASAGDFVAREVLVKFKQPTSLAEARQLLDGADFEVQRASYARLRIFLVRIISPGLSEPEAVDTLRTLSFVEQAYLNYVFEPCFIPNDDLFPDQWNLSQSPDSGDIRAPGAWELATGDTVWTRVYGNDYFDTGEQAICWPNNTCTVLSNYGNISGWWGTELSAIDGDGNILWRRFYLMSDDWIPWVAFAADRANRYIMAGRNGFGQLVIVKTQTDTLSGSSVENRGPSFTEKSIRISVAPNPFNSRTWIRVNVLHSGLLRLRVFNILGEQVLPLTERWIAAGEYTYPLDMANLSSATYFLRAEVKSSKVVVRISLEK